MGAMSDGEFCDWSPDGKYVAYVDRLSDQSLPTLFLLAVGNPQDRRPLTTSDGQWLDTQPRF